MKWPFVGEIHWAPMHSPKKGPTTMRGFVFVFIVRRYWTNRLTKWMVMLHCHKNAHTKQKCNPQKTFITAERDFTLYAVNNT